MKRSNDKRTALKREPHNNRGELVAIEEAWAVEAERRIAELDSGQVQAISINEALAQIRVELK